MITKEPNSNFYTYILLDPRKSGRYTYDNHITFLYEPFYVGKGKNNRYGDHISEAKRNKHSHKANKIRKLLQLTLLPIEIKLIYCSEDCALEYEKYLISTIGRFNINKGPLTNLTDGGEGTSGRVATEEQKLTLSKIKTGKKMGPLSEETKVKIGKSNSGKKRTPEQCKANAETQKKLGRWVGDKNPSKDPELRAIVNTKISGKGNGMYGKPSPMRGKKRPEITGDNNPAKRPESKAKIIASWDLARKEKHSNRMQGNNNPASKQIVVNGNLYNTFKEATIKESMSKYLILKAIAKDKEGFSWV